MRIMDVVDQGMVHNGMIGYLLSSPFYPYVFCHVSPQIWGDMTSSRRNPKFMVKVLQMNDVLVQILA